MRSIILQFLTKRTKSTAINKEGKKINGTIQQHGMSQKKPIDDQKLRLKYMKEEPVIFELIEPILFENKN